ncbi:sensor histidine kinase [Undibacterium flavidum]|uniref:Histidine kinase n=1 Tax=Undibacterium flavidum TaxID=2762297 RepID=A0ABR6Y8R5_9BURK|nr:histidine kinase [Undibacterium flavidum]MBC3872976.1 histidine kinase [Undibacterium flavidum]
MWKKISTWYQDWNEEMLNVLLHPEEAQKISIPWRRHFALRLTKLTSIERTQLHQFSVKYQGMAFWMAVLKLSAVFSMIGALLHFFRPKLDWWILVAVANLIGWAVAVSLIGIWFNYRRLSFRPVRFLSNAFLGVSLGLLGGTVLGAMLRGKDIWTSIVQDVPRVLMVAGIMGCIYALLVGIVAVWRNKNYEAITAQLELEAEREKNARQTSESQLRLLRAQIEPHFLFNTLGAVQQLAENGAPRAAELTANLIVFLRASMSEMRSEKITLAEEFHLIQAYLEVMKVRMGARLDFHLDLSTDLKAISIPSMMLLTLAENAIKHGIEPALRGGRIDIRAEKCGTDLLITVQDSGVGLSDTPNPGIGLQNVRDRLRLQYGAHAALSIFEAEQGGVIAEVSIPRC